MVRGVKDYSSLSEKELDKIIRSSVLKAYKWYDVDYEKRGEYFANKISVCNLNNFPGAYCMRSVRYQPAPPFWQGKGVVVMQNDKYFPAILHADEYVKRGVDMEKIDIREPVCDLPTLETLEVFNKS